VRTEQEPARIAARSSQDFACRQRAKLGNRSVTQIDLESFIQSPTSLSKASRPLLERADRAQEVDFAELWPINVREVEFAMDALP
jgi:hypothetical protein